MSGARSYHAGRAAESAVERHYRHRGLNVAARRWRGKGGEIDLVLRDGPALVFVEVKQALSHAAAAWRVTERQMARVLAAATEFVAGEPRALDTDMRFDVALVDGQGRVDIIEGAYAA
jgi:putative endonuclease